MAQEFVKQEFSVADLDGDGLVDFDEFVAYYNAIIERVEKNQLAKELEMAAQAADSKEENLSIAEDESTYQVSRKGGRGKVVGGRGG